MQGTFPIMHMLVDAPGSLPRGLTQGLRLQVMGCHEYVCTGYETDTFDDMV